MAERIPMTDLSGWKVSTRSFTGSMANLVAECLVEFELNTSSFIALGLTAFSESFDCSSCPVPTTDCVGSWAVTSALRGNFIRLIPPSTIVHLPRSSGFCEVEGTDVGKIEDPTLRSDSERDELAAGRSARRASMELASLLASPRAPRCFRDRRRIFGSFMLSLDRVDGGTITGRLPRGF